MHKSRGSIPSQWLNNNHSSSTPNGPLHNHPVTPNSLTTNSETKNKTVQTNNSITPDSLTPESSSKHTQMVTSPSQALAEELNALIQCTEDEEKKTTAAAPPDLVKSSLVHQGSEFGTPV